MPGSTPARTSRRTNGSTTMASETAGTTASTTDQSSQGQSTSGNTSNLFSSSVRDPWAGSEAVLRQIAERAGTLGGNTSLFTPTYSGASTDAVRMMEQAARAPSAAATVGQSVADGSGRGFSTGLGQLMATASGQGFDNPYLNRTLDVAAGRTADAVNRQFSGLGRYGSGAHTGVLTDRLGQMEAQARLDQYTRERGNQLAAANTLAGMGGQGIAAAQAVDQDAVRRAMLMQQAGGLQDQMATAAREAPLRAAEWQARMGLPLAGVGGATSGAQSGGQTGYGTTSNSASTNATGSSTSNVSGSGTNLSTTEQEQHAARDPLAMALGLGMAAVGAATGNPGMAMNGLNGLFGSGQVFSQPGSAANGGWSTTATAASPLMGLFG